MKQSGLILTNVIGQMKQPLVQKPYVRQKLKRNSRLSCDIRGISKSVH